MAVPTSEWIVVRFLIELALVRRDVLRETDQTDLLALLRDARSSDLPRSTTLPSSGISYEIHGFGCALFGPDGTEIDVDLMTDGREIFDDWRLHAFAVSRDIPSANRPLLKEACLRLKSVGLLDEPKAGWFALVDGDQ